MIGNYVCRTSECEEAGEQGCTWQCDTATCEMSPGCCLSTLCAWVPVSARKHQPWSPSCWSQQGGGVVHWRGIWHTYTHTHSLPRLTGCWLLSSWNPRASGWSQNHSLTVFPAEKYMWVSPRHQMITSRSDEGLVLMTGPPLMLPCWQGCNSSWPHSVYWWTAGTPGYASARGLFETTHTGPSQVVETRCLLGSLKHCHFPIQCCKSPSPLRHITPNRQTRTVPRYWPTGTSLVVHRYPEGQRLSINTGHQTTTSCSHSSFKHQ